MYLLDTCTFLWSIGDDPSLSKKVREIIEAGTGLYLSQTTLWEIAVKKTINKLNSHSLRTIKRLGNTRK